MTGWRKPRRQETGEEVSSSKGTFISIQLYLNGLPGLADCGYCGDREISGVVILLHRNPDPGYNFVALRVSCSILWDQIVRRFEESSPLACECALGVR